MTASCGVIPFDARMRGGGPSRKWQSLRQGKLDSALDERLFEMAWSALMQVCLRPCVLLIPAVLAACAPSHPASSSPKAKETPSETPVSLRSSTRSNGDGPRPAHTSSTRDTYESLAQTAAAARVTRTFRGQASYYSERLVGNLMASGKPYQSERPYAAHRTLPFGSLIRVVRESTGATVVLRVMDRGPFGDKRRVLDVSRSAAERLDMLRAGVVDVRVEVLSDSQ